MVTSLFCFLLLPHGLGLVFVAFILDCRVFGVYVSLVQGLVFVVSGGCCGVKRFAYDFLGQVVGFRELLRLFSCRSLVGSC